MLRPDLLEGATTVSGQKRPPDWKAKLKIAIIAGSPSFVVIVRPAESDASMMHKSSPELVAALRPEARPPALGLRRQSAWHGAWHPLHYQFLALQQVLHCMCVR